MDAGQTTKAGMMDVKKAAPAVQGNGACWQSNPSKYPRCVGYTSVGYKCVGDNCAACNPKGSPAMCAKKAAPGLSPNPATGKCDLIGTAAKTAPAPAEQTTPAPEAAAEPPAPEAKAEETAPAPEAAAE